MVFKKEGAMLAHLKHSRMLLGWSDQTHTEGDEKKLNKLSRLAMGSPQNREQGPLKPVTMQ